VRCFIKGDACFFILDVRRYRSSRTLSNDDPTKTLLGAKQLNDLKAWLLYANSSDARCAVKFIASPVPITATVGDKFDTWMGFTVERRHLIDFIATNVISKVIVLSGDRHSSAAIHVSNEITEFSASPVDGFWSVHDLFDFPAQGEERLGEWHSESHWGTVEVDSSGEHSIDVTVHIDGQLKRKFSQTMSFPKNY